MPFYTLACWRGANRSLNQVRAGNYLIVTPDRDAASLLYRFIKDEHKAIRIKLVSNLGLCFTAYAKLMRVANLRW